MSISKDDYEELIRKKPSLRPTEETKLMGFSCKPTEGIKISCPSSTQSVICKGEDQWGDPVSMVVPLIPKKRFKKPTEVIKSQNTHTALNGPIKYYYISDNGKIVEGFKDSLGELGHDSSCEHQNPSLMPKTHQIRPSNDEAKLNKTERAWLAELRIRRPKFLGIQSMTFKLGDDCRYTPDFVEISQEDKFIAWEVKGFMRDDALVKLKVAARMFSFIEFYVVKSIKGAWETKKINP